MESITQAWSNSRHTFYYRTIRDLSFCMYERHPRIFWNKTITASTTFLVALFSRLYSSVGGSVTFGSSVQNSMTHSFGTSTNHILSSTNASILSDDVRIPKTSTPLDKVLSFSRIFLTVPS